MRQSTLVIVEIIQTEGRVECLSCLLTCVVMDTLIALQVVVNGIRVGSI